MKRLIILLASLCSISANAISIEFDNIVQSVVVVESSTINKPASLGTGFYFEDNYIITNYHVVKDYNTFTVRTYNDFGPIKAKLIGYDRYTDLAILETDESAPRLMPITPQTVRLGEDVYVVGHPFGYEFTVSKGIVSSLDRFDSKYPFITYMQTDANVQSGSSGSPVLNQHGKVIGILKATVNSTVSAGISLAVTLPLIKDSIKKIKEQKIVERPSLIFISEKDRFKSFTPETNMQLTAGQDSQKHIYSNKQTKTGISLYSVNGIKVSSSSKANEIIQSLMPGDKVTIVYRKGNSFVTDIVELENLN